MLLGELAFRGKSIRGNIIRGNVVREMVIRKMVVRGNVVGEMSLGESALYHFRYLWFYLATSLRSSMRSVKSSFRLAPVTFRQAVQ
jgi:hypothetical protein